MLGWAGGGWRSQGWLWRWDRVAAELKLDTLTVGTFGGWPPTDRPRTRTSTAHGF
jgi:hypothetical protein